MSLNELHEVMYNNIKLLTLVYKPTSKFLSVFKADMFLKNNKAAFQEVAYYLLWVLDKEKMMEKVTIWPVFGPKEEAQFRNEVMQYINEINKGREDAHLPVLMTSHLIFPGGRKFIEFMLDLSAFVLREHVKRDEKTSQCLLEHFNANENSANCNVKLQILKEKIDFLAKETETIKNDYLQKHDNLRIEANELAKTGQELEEERTKLTQDEANLQQINSKNTNENNFDFQQVINSINANLPYLIQLSELVINYNALVDDLKSNELVFEALNLNENFNVLINLQKAFALLNKNKMKFLLSKKKTESIFQILNKCSLVYEQVLDNCAKSKKEFENVNKYLEMCENETVSI